MTPYYQDEAAGTTIYCGDCREILPTLPKVDLVLTDPPYGVGLQYASVVDDVRLVDIAVGVINEMRAKCRVVLTPGVRNLFRYPEPTHTGSFQYPAGTGVTRWGFTCWQPILFYGSDPYGGKGSRPDSFVSGEAAEKNGHPCTKPIGQWLWLLRRCSVDSDLVLDPFMGSGTTLVACKRLGRKGIGIEIEERYCEIAAQRLERERLELFEPMPEQLELTPKTFLA